jgi:hypothetical protein
LSKRTNKLPSALKHGGYSLVAVLPGEDKAAFEKLHQELIAELKPSGALEEDIVMTIARLLWRKQNLKVCRLASAAKKAHDELVLGEIRRRKPPPDIQTRLKNFTRVVEARTHVDSPMDFADLRAIYTPVIKRMGTDYIELATIADQVTVANLQDELALIERIDCMIDRATKRFLLIRGIKSLSASAAAPTEAPRLLSTQSCG